jgi:hypothetical protein
LFKKVLIFSVIGAFFLPLVGLSSATYIDQENSIYFSEIPDLHKKTREETTIIKQEEVAYSKNMQINYYNNMSRFEGNKFLVRTKEQEEVSISNDQQTKLPKITEKENLKTIVKPPINEKTFSTHPNSPTPKNEINEKKLSSPPPVQEPKEIKEDGEPELDSSKIREGVLRIKYPRISEEKIKVMIQKDGTKYTYDLISKSNYEVFPLQLGNGMYKVSVLKNVGGTSYKSIVSWDVELNLEDSTIVYINSIQLVSWNEQTKAVIKARELSKNIFNEEEKVKIIYNYIINNIEYDNDKLVKLSSSYIPNVNKVYSNKRGICYDFASTFAAMLRSVNVPTKLVMGNSINVSGYHAWNEVYINGNWIIIDTSYDSQLKALSKATVMVKNRNQYAKTKEY